MKALAAAVARQIFRGVSDMRLNPWAQVLTLAAVTLVAFLGGMLLLFIHNLDQELLKARGDVVYQVFWRPGTDMETVRTQWAAMDSLPYLADRTTWTPGQGLDALAETLGSGVDLSAFREESPLPPTALLSFEPQAEDPDLWSRDMLSHLESLAGVERVHYHPLRTDLAKSWAKFSRRMVFPLIGFLGVVLALIVGNTIKLSLISRRNEIEILQLVGARRWYIQLPLLTGGAVQGLFGGVLAVGMLKLMQLGLDDLLSTPPLHLSLRFLPLEQAAGLVGVLTLVGIVGSWVAVRR